MSSVEAAAATDAVAEQAVVTLGRQLCELSERRFTTVSFRHPTKKATLGRYSSVSFVRPA